MNETKTAQLSEPLRILVVEDSQLDRKMIESMLKESPAIASYIFLATNLSEALNILDYNQFHVVILDLDLPDSKGLESLKSIHEKSPDIPIVVNTGAYEDDLGLQTLSHGAQDFLVKGKYNVAILKKVLYYAIERKRLEIELKATMQKLKSTQSQLIQAEKMKIVGSLASGVAHEVRNPLATILYGVNYLKDSLKDKGEKVDSVLDNITEAANKANEIVVDLLNFSSLQKFNFEQENLNQVAEDALSLVNHSLERHNIEVVRDFSAKIPKIKIDGNRVQQVLVNLILNAVHAMGEGGEIHLKTSTAKVSKDMHEVPGNGFKPGEEIVILDVEDSGKGVPEDKLTEIFEPFYTTNRSSGGVGLGLPVSQNIMEMHGGHLSIQNRKEGGARATVIFKA